MKEKSIVEVEESRQEWEALEAYARDGIRCAYGSSSEGRASENGSYVRLPPSPPWARRPSPARRGGRGR